MRLDEARWGCVVETRGAKLTRKPRIGLPLYLYFARQ